MAKKKQKYIEYDLVYHIPLEDSGWPKSHNIAYRTDTHMVTNPKRIQDTRNADLSPVRRRFEEDGWSITDTESGFLCKKNGYCVEYREVTAAVSRKRYWYGMRLRPCGPGCQPKGFLDWQEADKWRDGYWSYVCYSRPLSQKDMTDYDLDYVYWEED